MDILGAFQQASGLRSLIFLVLGDVGAIMGTAMLGLESGSLSNFLLAFFLHTSMEKKV